MKKTVNLISFTILAFFFSILFYSCSKNTSMNDAVMPGSQSASIYLTDGPGFFDKVLIDIRSVQVLVDTCSTDPGSWRQNGGDGRDNRGGDDNDDRRSGHDTCNVWESLNITPGVYDLLTLRNGSDTLLAGATIPAGSISFIKIQLGPDDSLVKDSITYPLHLRDSSVILVDTRSCRWDEFKPKHFRLWLDFDVSRSVVNVHDNEFFLDPFVRIFTMSTTGSLSGDVMPRDAFPVITVFNSSDSAFALPGRDGNFKVRGLTPGTYSVFVNASNGYADTTISGINVTANQNVWLGNIKLHK